jgi:hypothetical protein
MNISNQIRDIHVFDDRGDGVKSELFKIDDVGVRSRLVLTDEHGYKQVYLLCKRGDQIEAIPKSENYFQRTIDCAKSKTIMLELVLPFSVLAPSREPLFVVLLAEQLRQHPLSMETM